MSDGYRRQICLLHCLLPLPLMFAGEFSRAAERRVDAVGDPLPPEIRMRLGSTRLWHRNLDKISFSADGKKLLSLPYVDPNDKAKFKMNCLVWDVATGKLLKTLPTSKFPQVKQQYYHEKVATPDGKGVLLRAWQDVCYRDNKLGKIRWRVRVAPQVPGPGLKTANANRIAFSPDGKTAALGSNCGRIVLVDWRTGKLVKASRRQIGLYKEPFSGLYDESVGFSPDGAYMIVADALEREVVMVVCRVRTGKEAYRLKKSEVHAWTSDSKYFVRISWTTKGNDYIHLTNAATGKDLWKTKAILFPDGVWVSRDGKSVTYREGETLHVLNARDGNTERKVRLSPAGTTGRSSLAISPNRKRIVVKSTKKREMEVRNKTGGKIWSKKVPASWMSWAARFVGDYCVAVVVKENEVDSPVVHILDATTGRKLCEMLSGNRYGSPIIATSPDGKVICIRGLKEERELRSTKAGRIVYKFKPQSARRHHVRFSPDGKWCAFNTDDHTIEVRESATGKLVNKFRRTEHFLRDLSFAPNSQSIALTFNDCTVWLWDAVKNQSKTN